MLYLFLLSKLMGEKQITQLSLLDYIIGISIGSIAAEMATNLENNPILPAISMSVYAGLDFCISYANRKSLKIRRFINGRPLVLMDGGVIYRENFKKARLELGDFLTFCRAAGYFNLDQIQTAVMEHSGQISILPKASRRPVTPADLGIEAPEEHLVLTVISDGTVNVTNLHPAGKNEAWLAGELKNRGYRAPSDVFYAFIDADRLHLYPMIPKNPIFPDFE